MKKKKIGIIGVGHWGPNFVRNFHTHLKSTVAMVSDTNTKRLELIAERYPDIKLTQTADEVISHPDLDAVVICTPTVTHYELTKKALEKGKSVFVEKPLATDYKECKELVTLAEKAKRLLFVGHIFVYNKSIQTVKKYIDQGELGHIYYIYATRTNLGPVRQDVSALWDLAPHDISIFQYWLGCTPDKVSARGGHFLSTSREDVGFATYHYPSKSLGTGQDSSILANIHVSWLSPKKVREIVIVGEKKMLVWDDMDITNPIRIYDKKIVVDNPPQNQLVDSFMGFRASIQEGDTLMPKIQMNEPLSAECTAFLEALDDPSKSLSNGRHGADVVKVLQATDLSMQKGGAEVRIE